MTYRLQNNQLAGSSNDVATLFTDVTTAAGRALGIASIRHVSGLLELATRKTIAPDIVPEVYSTIERNWRQARLAGGAAASTENWRWCRPQTYIAEHNSSAEVRLERAIVVDRPEWANQVPVCSGVAGPSADRRRAIDLVHKAGEAHFEFIELKIASDTPLYAAIEIIGYGCVWLLARADSKQPTTELLEADRIDLVVLAPANYYSRYRLDTLSTALDTQVALLGNSRGAQLSFRFEVLPARLAEPILPSGEELTALLNRRTGL